MHEIAIDRKRFASEGLESKIDLAMGVIDFEWHRNGVVRSVNAIMRATIIYSRCFGDDTGVLRTQYQERESKLVFTCGKS
jgi:hypothetical protein